MVFSRGFQSHYARQQKDPDRHPSQALSSDYCQYSTLGVRKLGSERRKQVETGNVSSQLSRRICNWTMWDIAEKRITNEKVRRTAGNSPTTESTMEMRRCRWLSKLSVMEKSRSPRRMLGAWCPTPRPHGRPQQTIRHAYITTLRKLGFEEEKGQLREWMTIARDRSAWGERVESHLDLPPGSFTNLRRH